MHLGLLLRVARVRVQLRVVNQYCSLAMEEHPGMDLKKVAAQLTQFAPPSLAASWDNTGLLVEPSPPHLVRRLMLTNDLTEPVLAEALDNKADMILSYHPPIFVPLKRVTQCSWKERLVVKCLENRVALYSPHTSCDALQGGVNDWLLQPFSGVSEPIQRSECNGPAHKAEVSVPASQAPDVARLMHKISGVKVIAQYKAEGNSMRIVARCNDAGLHKLIAYLESVEGLRETLELSRLEKLPSSNQGAGRIMKLDTPMSLDDIVSKVKGHLHLPHVRLAVGVGVSSGSVMKRVAVCAGSGGSVLSGVSADVYVTGEMSHHEVLDATHRGRSVILCDHSNTERGYLAQVMRQQLSDLFDNNIEVMVSQTDADPLTVV